MLQKQLVEALQDLIIAVDKMYHLPLAHTPETRDKLSEVMVQLIDMRDRIDNRGTKHKPTMTAEIIDFKSATPRGRC